MASFLHYILELQASLQALGEKMEDKSLGPIILRALLEKFCTFVMNLNILDQKLTFEKLVNMLQQEEASHVTSYEEEQAMISNQQGKKPFQ